jgi:hypothetical protein
MLCDKCIGILERAAVFLEPSLLARLSHNRFEIYAKPAGFLDQSQILIGVTRCLGRVTGLAGFSQKPIDGDIQDTCQGGQTLGGGSTIGFPLADSARGHGESFSQFPLRDARTLPSGSDSSG